MTAAETIRNVLHDAVCSEQCDSTAMGGYERYVAAILPLLAAAWDEGHAALDDQVRRDKAGLWRSERTPNPYTTEEQR